MKFSKLLPSHVTSRAEKDTPRSASLLDSKKSPHTSRPSRFRRFTSDWWSWEISSIAFSLGCSVALIVILNKYDSQPVPQWRHGITLNAIISILATAAKGALLLPVAEAISQHKWLWFRRSQRKLQDIATFDNASRGPWGALTMLLKINVRDIASAGALITVLSLAFDPFMQQVVVYRLRAIPKNTAVIGRSQEWSYHSSDIIDANDISLTLKAAFYNGLFNGNAAPQLTPACATGNCTWLPVSSLAFCTKCEDLTSTSPVACNVTRTVAPYDYGYTGGPCSFNIPGSPGLPNFHYQAQSNTAGTHSLKMAVLSTATIGQNGRSFEGIPGPYGGFARVLFSTNSPNVTNVTTCVMFPCIKTYNVSVSDGSLVTREHSSWYSENGIDYNDLGPFMFIPPSTQTAYGIASLLEAAFNGSSTVDSIDGEAFTSDYMQALYPTGDLGQLMGNVADSLTNYIRHSSSIPYYGTAWDTENYVHVRWVWLILPMALAPVALVFLLSAIWLSSRWDTKVWKSSSLATIFHGFERPIDTINLNWQSEMDELSKQFRVKLQQASDKTHNLMLIGSQVAQFHKESLNPAAASDEFEHIAPPYLTTSNHETRGEDIRRQDSSPSG